VRLCISLDPFWTAVSFNEPNRRVMKLITVTETNDKLKADYNKTARQLVDRLKKVCVCVCGARVSLCLCVCV